MHELSGVRGLNRGEICCECGFGRSVLGQNPRIKEALQQLGDRLRAAGVLPAHLPQGQGSQFKRVIIAVSQTLNLDRTMLYTALTRAKKQVLLIGDHVAARRAIEAPPHAASRNVALGEFPTET